MATTKARKQAPAVELHEYAFDVKLFAVVRVKAANQQEAVTRMRKVIDAADVSSLPKDVGLTEFSLEEDGEDENEEPFEIDGEPT